jgi:hypothetical protein
MAKTVLRRSIRKYFQANSTRAKKETGKEDWN